MNVPLSRKWQAFVDEEVRSGRFPSSEAVVEAGLELMAEQERRLAELKAHLEAAIAEGGSYTDEEVEAELEARYARRIADRS
ncbi:type II toxin-antitoxin system ParD family antitoxin [Azorhizobium oxalatiphilum]|nr:type II toxin-antitoxin system ParD family antitoxin [Azorhizobium oxalatiphilum]